ncbi:MAG: ABC transporter permease [Chloroflexota bacterium]|nr:ABC transporter permease [Chloroflexota bacterium]
MKALAIAASNLRRFARERSNVFFVLILPMLLILVLGSVFGRGFEPRVGLVAPGTGDPTSALVEGLEAHEGFVVHRHDDGDTVVRAVERGELEAGLILPPGYDEAIRDGSAVEIDFIARTGQDSLSIRRTIDALLAEQMALPRIAAFVSREAEISYDQALARAAAVTTNATGVQVAATVAGESFIARRSWGQFDLGAQQQLMLFMFLTSLAGSAALVQTRRLGIARRMFATPTTVRTILLGEGLGRFGVALVQGVYIMLGTMLIFGVRWGDPLSAVMIVLAFGLVGSGAAMLMGALFSNDQQAAPVGVFLGLGTAALGGCMMPLYVMELFAPAVWTAAHVMPHAWALEAFEVLAIQDGGLGDVLPFLGILLGYAAAFYVLAIWRLRVVLTR